MIPTPGIHYDVPFDTYKLWECVNNSLLKAVKQQSPRHAKYYQEHPSPATPALLTGIATHLLILEPERFAKRCVVAPEVDRRTKSGKELWAAFEATATGRQIIRAEEYETITAMAAGFGKQIIQGLLRKGKSEVSLVWVDPETGLLCKARCDYVHFDRDIIVDLKTCQDASRDRFARDMWNHGYYQQAAFYSDGYEVVTGRTPAFTFVPMEKAPPYAAAAYETQPATIDAGRRSYRQALTTWAECVKSNHFPGYADEVLPIDLPDWAMKAAGINEYNMEAL